MMKSTELVAKVRRIAETTETVYMWGTFGNPVTESIISQKIKQYPDRYSAERQQFLRSRIGRGVWAWDCVGLIKGILWGWDGDANKAFGGAVYESNGVPDATASGMFNACRDISSDLSSIAAGELVSKPDHIGVYLGDGTVGEATLDSEYDGVVITPFNGRGWHKHGKCAYVEYEKEQEEPKAMLWLHVDSVGVRVRQALQFSGGKASGKILTLCPIGEDVEILEFIPGIQPDSYQWIRGRYDGQEGYCQLDSQHYYVYQK